jgi:cytochrome c-type biogenesis protein CcmH/NrfG
VISPSCRRLSRGAARRFPWGVFLAVILLAGCRQLEVRIEIQEANRAYLQQQFDVALVHYLGAQRLDPGLADLDRLIAYCYIGQFEPQNAAPRNQRLADAAIGRLRQYLAKRPDDATARDALVSLYLAADRPKQAIDFYAAELQKHPDDLESAKSIATLYASQGDFPGALHWYREIARIDARNPEAFYIYGVVLYEKVAKAPDADQAANLRLIEEGKAALARATELRPGYFEALVYTNLLIRQQAAREVDETRRDELLAQADDVRARAIASQQARQTAKAKS